MKSKILGLLALGLLAGPMAANAYIITISGSEGGAADGLWDISTTSGTQTGLVNILDQQVWWGNSTLAQLFTSTLAGGLGYPNSNGNRGPAFAVCNDGCLFGSGAEGWRYGPSISSEPIGYTGFDEVTMVFAVAERVPEPGTLALLGLGLAGLGLSRRRKAN